MRSSKCIIFQSPNKEMWNLYHGILTKEQQLIDNPFKIKEDDN